MQNLEQLRAETKISEVKEIINLTQLSEEKLSKLYGQLEAEGFGHCFYNSQGQLSYFIWYDNQSERRRDNVKESKRLH